MKRQHPLSSFLVAALPLLALVLCTASACGQTSREDDEEDEPAGNALPKADDCTNDEDCDAAEACHLTDSAGYCAPRCATENDCPAPVACPSGEEQPGARSCDKAADEDVQGACDLFVGAFGPDTCAAAAMTCSENEVGGTDCTCSIGVDPGSDSTCPTATMPAATCCATVGWPGAGTCECSLVECASFDGSCLCAQHQVITALDLPPGPTAASCPAPQPGGVCCVTSAGCWCEDEPSICDTLGEVVVPNCDAAAVSPSCSGELGPVSSCTP